MPFNLITRNRDAGLDPYFGFDREVVEDLMDGLLYNPITGLFILEKTPTACCPSRRPDTLEERIEAVHRAKLYDFSALPVDVDSVWVLHLFPLGKVDYTGRTGKKTKRPEFALRWTGGADGYPTRVARCVGPPTCEHVLNFIRVSLMECACVPGLLLLGEEFEAYKPQLNFFFEKLRPPFCSMVVPSGLQRSLAEEYSEGVFDRLADLAVDANTVANDAYNQGDRARALYQHSQAIHWMETAMCMTANTERRRTARQLLSVFRCHEAAALLLKEGGGDQVRALHEAEAGTSYAPTYPKVLVTLLPAESTYT
ncbi:hypothetical protein BV25DRAFT_1922897 [Artomyces pyxidatus]|uniref:Uncharacterized protein n=1 Tax=Artomyces pyxidatus TaxID=48021 RepID=A0ACB8SD98_9AGAM|nr:hypothetical protein BV25DRAFT_1922897 [Artomyces pyxidatus]